MMRCADAAPEDIKSMSAPRLAEAAVALADIVCVNVVQQCLDHVWGTWCVRCSRQVCRGLSPMCMEVLLP